MSPDVHTWLDSLGLAAYSAAFSANKVDFAVLRDLTSDDLKEIGVTAVGDRRKLLAAIAALGTPTTEASPTVEPRPEASRRQVTVLFADLSGFTALTNSMDAEDTHAMLNRFFMAVDGAVQRFGGRIDKHIGDAVMAVFGAPVSHTNDPERALRAALEIHAAVARLDPPLAVHIGVASGQVIASTTGSDAHVEYTVTGDGVNLAARLTDMAPTGQTYLSHEVQRSVGAPFMGEPTGVQTIKGIKDPVEVWRLSGLAPEDRRRRQRFVGRTRELALFAAAFDNCGKSGSGAVHIVRGEPGIGKSHILEEIGDLSSTYSFSVHCSTVLDFGAGEGQSPIQSLVRSLLDIRPDGDVAAHTNAVRSALTKGWTGQAEAVHLNALFDLPQDPGVAEVYAVMDNAVRVQGRLKVVRDLIAARCHAEPVLLEIEDIHWATADLLSALADIAASIRDLPCVLIMTTRIAGDPIDGNWLARTKGTPVAKRDLLPLGDDDARLLAQDYAANDPGILSTCVARAGGNPLFLEQLLRNLEAVGSDTLPGSIQGIVQARLDVLDSRWRGMIQVASVLGQRFSPDALKHLLKQEALDVSGLLDASLLREAGADLYFAHALIRDGSYETLLRSRRLELHNRAAEWFADRDLTLHARHLDLAEAPDRSRAYLAAARRDIDNYQYDQALPLLERAFELDCAADVRVDLVCAKGEVLRFLGRSTEAIEAFDTALKLATDSNQLCRAHIGRAQAARQTSRYEDALESLDIAERAAEQTGVDQDVALINYIRGNVYFPLGRVKDALAANERVIAFARQTNSVRLLVGALSGFGDANYMMGAMRTADNFYNQAIDLARDHHLTRDLAANLHNRGFARIFDAQIEAGLVDVEESLKLARTYFIPLAETISLLGAGIVATVVEEDFDKALNANVEALTITKRIGAKRFEAQALGYQARLLALHGRKSEAEEVGREGAAMALEHARNFSSPMNLSALATTLDDLEEQDRLLATGAQILSEGCVSHCHFLFYADAISIMLARQSWHAALGYAAALEDFTRSEPLQLMDLTIRQARLLANCGRLGTTRGAESEFNELHRQFADAGIRRTYVSPLDPFLK